MPGGNRGREASRRGEWVKVPGGKQAEAWRGAQGLVRQRQGLVQELAWPRRGEESVLVLRRCVREGVARRRARCTLAA